MLNKKIKFRGVNYILYAKNKFIILQKRDNKTRTEPNKWVFPGGALNKNEDCLNAVVREIEEETGIKLGRSECKFFSDFRYPWYKPTERNRFFIAYLPRRQRIKPERIEGQKMQWKNLKTIKNLNLGGNQNSIIPKIESILKKRGATNL